MKLKWKVCVMVLIPMASLLAVLALGLHQLMKASAIQQSTTEILVDGLLKKQIMPLIDQQMLPLINDDMTLRNQLGSSVILLLEADRDVHQALIGEKMALSATAEDFAAIQKEHQENVTQAKDRVTQAALAFTAAEKAKYAEFEKAYSDWEQKTSRVLTMAQEPGQHKFAIKASNGGSAHKAFVTMRNLIDEMQTMQEKRIAQLNQKIISRKDMLDKQKTLIDNNARTAESESQDSIAANHQAVILFSAIGGLGLLASLLLSIIIAASIIKPVLAAINFAKVIQTGDLSHRMNIVSKDEIGYLTRLLDSLADSLQEKSEAARSIAGGNLLTKVPLASDHDALGIALNDMESDLQNIIGQAKQAAEEVNNGAGQISSASSGLSDGATSQAASIQQISASITEMSSQTSASAENASEVSKLACAVRNSAENGNRQMSDMVAAMRNISTSSEQIKKIIKVIDGIAFQTNLLALNAAVEAARAGQFGKGFAVVADEVRSLAARSASAAAETANLIEDSAGKVKTGSKFADDAAITFGEIVEGVQKMVEIITDIAKATHEQAQGISQINQALQQVDAVTQQNTANAEETASAAAQLSALATSLNDLLVRFKTDDRRTYGEQYAPGEEDDEFALLPHESEDYAAS